MTRKQEVPVPTYAAVFEVLGTDHYAYEGRSASEIFMKFRRDPFLMGFMELYLRDGEPLWQIPARWAPQVEKDTRFVREMIREAERGTLTLAKLRQLNVQFNFAPRCVAVETGRGALARLTARFDCENIRPSCAAG